MSSTGHDQSGMCMDDGARRGDPALRAVADHEWPGPAAGEKIDLASAGMPDSESVVSKGADQTPAYPEPQHSLTNEIFERCGSSFDLPPGKWPAPRSVPVSVLIPVLNEEQNLVECVRRLQWAAQIAVIDSQSRDLTVPLAQAMGCEVYQFRISTDGWPKKKNWALQHVAWSHEWVLIMDADEHMTPELAREIEHVVTGRYPPGNGCGDGYWINRRFMFMGRWIRHCGYYPSWNVRLFKHGIGRYERIGQLGHTGSGDNEVHEHVVLSTGEAGYLRNEFLHYAYPDVAAWVEKHNRYATWEAHAMMVGYDGNIRPTMFGGPVARRRWLKARTTWLPFRPTFRFLYCYVIKGGFLDGYPGYVMSRLLAWYEFCATAKYREMVGKKGDAMGSASGQAAVLERAEGPARELAGRMSAMNSESESDGGDIAAGTEALSKPQVPSASFDDEAIIARHTSPWSMWEKIGRMLWYLTEATLFHWSPRPMYRWRNFLLRLFGAQVHKSARIRPTVTVEVPWNLTVGKQSIVGDFAILYCLGPVTIGERVTISQYAHLCAGSHDFTRSDMPLLKPPIVIEDDVWVSADVFVGPGVRIGQGVVVGARANVFSDLPPWKICVGSPAKAVRARVLDNAFSPELRQSD